MAPRLCQTHGHQALGPIAQQGEYPSGLPQGTDDIGGADVATATVAQVSPPMHTRNEQAKGERAKQIGQDDERQIREHSVGFQSTLARYLRR